MVYDFFFNKNKEFRDCKTTWLPFNVFLSKATDLIVYWLLGILKPTWLCIQRLRDHDFTCSFSELREVFQLSSVACHNSAIPEVLFATCIIYCPDKAAQHWPIHADFWLIRGRWKELLHANKKNHAPRYQSGRLAPYILDCDTILLSTAHLSARLDMRACVGNAWITLVMQQSRKPTPHKSSLKQGNVLCNEPITLHMWA
jgi:hypothetical protein